MEHQVHLRTLEFPYTKLDDVRPHYDQCLFIALVEPSTALTDHRPSRTASEFNPSPIEIVAWIDKSGKDSSDSKEGGSGAYGASSEQAGKSMDPFDNPKTELVRLLKVGS